MDFVEDLSKATKEVEDKIRRLEKEVEKDKKELKKVYSQLSKAEKIIQDQKNRDKLSKRSRSPEESPSVPGGKKINNSCSPKKALEMSGAGKEQPMEASSSTAAETSEIPTQGGPLGPVEQTGLSGNVNQMAPVTDYDLAQVSDQVDNLVIESLSSYAEKLKHLPKRPKEVFPYCLFILAGSDGSKRLNKTLWEDYLEFTRDENDKIEDEETLFQIEIEFNDYNSGLGILACRNKFTSEWIRKITLKFKSDDQVLKPQYRWERDHALVFQGNCRGDDLKRKGVKAHVLLAKSLKRYKIPGEFKNCSFQFSKNSNGAWLKFEPSPLLAKSLENRRMILYIQGYKTTLEAHYRKQRSEQEFVAFYEEQNKKFKEIFEEQEAKRIAEREEAEKQAPTQEKKDESQND